MVVWVAGSFNVEIQSDQISNAVEWGDLGPSGFGTLPGCSQAIVPSHGKIID